MTTLDLINSIELGNTRVLETTFNELMHEKIKDALENKRTEINQSIFDTESGE